MLLDRYTRKEMGDIWTLESRFQMMLEVEKTVSKVQGELDLIPKSVAQKIIQKACFQLDGILENEKQTKHDVTAFVQEVARNVGGSDANYVHLGLTSSDVLDTALSLQIRRAYEELKKSFASLKQSLIQQCQRHAKTLCVGRTHGKQAEPLTFGLKLLGFLLELNRNKERVEKAVNQVLVGKMSGAVGAYNTLPPELEKRVCDLLKLSPEPVATQVTPRDRHASLILSLAMVVSGLERLAVEIRHLQRSEVAEVAEAFTAGQTGSSAMPHKKNPIYSENITGLSRLLRSYMNPALENNILWHERDISHSSVERVIFPSAFILCDFALNRMSEVIKNLYVDENRMLKNLKKGGEMVFSSILLTALVQKGMPRETAYHFIQSFSFSLQDEKENQKKSFLEDKTVLTYLSRKELEEIFSLDNKKKQIGKRVLKMLKSL